MRPRSIPIPPLSYTPWLHDHYSLLSYYGCSDPGGPVSRHPPWFPDSRRLDFIPCHLQSSVPILQPRSTPSALSALFCSDFVFSPQTRHRHRPKRVHFAAVNYRRLVTAWNFSSSCSPPGVLAPMQLLSDTGPTVSARSGTSIPLS